jgi:hypothetical protein
LDVCVYAVVVTKRQEVRSVECATSCWPWFDTA